MPTVADLLVGGLHRAGTSRLFAAAASASALVDAARRHGVGVSLAASDAAASLMAAVTGELTGVPGASISLDATLATVASALAYARAEWAPVIVVTEHDGTSGGVAAPAFRALAKQSLRVEASSAAHWIAHAARLALAEPPGPVHLDIRSAGTIAALPVAARVTPDRAMSPDAGALDRASALIARAHRPLILAGRGARGPETVGWLRAFAEARPAPVLVTPKGRGVMPDPHPLTLGTIEPAAADVFARADLLVAIGVDATEVLAIDWPDLPVLRLARSPIERESASVLDLVGEPALALEELAPRLRDAPRADWDVAELDRLKRARAATGVEGTAGRVARIARELSPAGTIATVDAGEYAPAVMAAWQAVMPGELLASSVLGLPGFALPAAIASQLARPSHRVLCFTSAHGVIPVLGELATMARMEPAPIVVALPEGPADLDLADVARAAGIHVASVSVLATFGRELDRALVTAGPSAILVADRGSDTPPRSLAFALGPR